MQSNVCRATVTGPEYNHLQLWGTSLSGGQDRQWQMTDDLWQDMNCNYPSRNNGQQIARCISDTKGNYLQH